MRVEKLRRSVASGVGGALVAASVLLTGGVRAAETCVMKTAPVWDFAKDLKDVKTLGTQDAAALEAVRAKDGFIPLDADHAFALPCTVLKDSQAFTMEMKLRFDDATEKRDIQLLCQKTPTTGWYFNLMIWGGVGSPMSLGMNDADFNVGWFRTKPGETHTFVITARRGLTVVYWNGRVLKRLFATIIPNLEDIRVGPSSKRRKGDSVQAMEGVKLLSLKFWGPGEEFWMPGEPKTFAEGYRGGPGWLMSCPTEDPNVKLPRILCYGDSILGGYGSRLRKYLEGKAYVYLWRGFVGGADGDKVWSKPFVAAAKVAPFDVIVFNNGLHSLHWTEAKVSDERLVATQKAILKGFRAGAPQAKIWWLATTPQTGKRNAQGKVDAMGELNPIVLRINRLTSAAMQTEGVPTIDAYTLLADKLNLACGDGYHWSGAAYDLMVQAIAARILR